MSAIRSEVYVSYLDTTVHIRTSCEEQPDRLTDEAIRIAQELAKIAEGDGDSQSPQ